MLTVPSTYPQNSICASRAMSTASACELTRLMRSVRHEAAIGRVPVDGQVGEHVVLTSVVRNCDVRMICDANPGHDSVTVDITLFVRL